MGYGLYFHYLLLHSNQRETTTFFNPLARLRHRDPLSSYIFILCMKVLFINDLAAHSSKFLHGHLLSPISFLLMMYYSFSRVSQEFAGILREFLMIYSRNRVKLSILKNLIFYLSRILPEDLYNQEKASRNEEHSQKSNAKSSLGSLFTFPPPLDLSSLIQSFAL